MVLRIFTSGKTSGTGIGVFYSKQFDESLGGLLKIDSAAQKGTTICLNIPKNHIIADQEPQIQKNSAPIDFRRQKNESNGYSI